MSSQDGKNHMGKLTVGLLAFLFTEVLSPLGHLSTGPLVHD